ncbi:DUF4198 domain-containing protein [Phaeobacter gallaeciensis]|uniref:DUF4198 domain-containing protein n=1 Tax=Phaeobacter gallaeciensis TaxID=60890 RepID=UPI000BBC7322|nr:DUF4198 domain-containing protein [Phaeobacter gallaeciensis]ATF18442.1 Domain protein of unknown function [Phaeobacter gallaeciensis]ATF22551.1 Domain protein of unknown function [Phaeobacter gallaeciensis]
MRFTRPVAFILLALAATTLGRAALAHEFWIAPEKYQVKLGASVQADLRNGQVFSGARLAYFDRNIARFEVWNQAEAHPYSGRMGDLPALQLEAPAEGLLVVAHETTPDHLTYDSWEDFVKFAAHKDFPDIEQRHSARNLPRTGFAERYTRHAKSLIAVGNGAGSDRAIGMLTEFVALANPYSDDLSTGLPVELRFQNRPRADAQVEVFERAPDDTVSVTLIRTDADGRAVVPVKSGHIYLLDAVVLRPVDPEAASRNDSATKGQPTPVWQTHWAALTFAVP